MGACKLCTTNFLTSSHKLSQYSFSLQPLSFEMRPSCSCLIVLWKLLIQRHGVLLLFCLMSICMLVAQCMMKNAIWFVVCLVT